MSAGPINLNIRVEETGSMQKLILIILWILILLPNIYLVAKNAAKGTRQHARITKSHLPLKVVFHQRSSSTEGHLPPKVVFHQRSSSPKGCLPPKVFFQRRSSSIQGHLPLKVIFHRRLSSIKGRPPIKGRLPCKQAFITNSFR